MRKYTDDSQKIKNSISVDNKNRYKTSYEKCFDAAKIEGKVKQVDGNQYYKINFKKAAD